jgi:FkbM family methyltransferase
MRQFVQKIKNSILWKKISYSGPYQRIRFPKQFKEFNKEFHFFLSLLSANNKLIFDIGANTGYKTAIFRRLAKRVVCFEPSPNAVKTLKNRFAYSNVTILPIALSDKKSFAQLHVVAGRETLNSINSKQLKKVIQIAAKGRSINSISVPTETLDNMIEILGTPQYIKIDVEGNEKEVISGLSKPVRLLSFENCTPNFLYEGISSIEHLHNISDGKALFNIFVNDTFIFERFSDPDLIKDHLKNNDYTVAEIFCRTS